MIPQPIIHLLERVGTDIPEALGLLDGPGNTGGIWWVDVYVPRKSVTLFWHAERGFGIWTKEDDDPGFGVHPDEYTYDLERVIEHVKHGLAERKQKPLL